MTVKEILKHFASLGDEKIKAQNAKRGAGKDQYGVKLGDVRKLADKIKTNHALALELWETGNLEARMLAILIMDVKKLSNKEIIKLVKSEKYTWTADWLYSYIIKNYADNETLRQDWMTSKDIMCARAGWSLTSGCVARNPERLDIPALLDRIEKEMGKAAPEVQWTMNSALANIGIHFPAHRKRAVAIGEKLGVYKDYPVSKGCTSPFAPIWINEMVKRQK